MYRDGKDKKDDDAQKTNRRAWKRQRSRRDEEMQEEQGWGMGDTTERKKEKQSISSKPVRIWGFENSCVHARRQSNNSQQEIQGKREEREARRCKGDIAKSSEGRQTVK